MLGFVATDARVSRKDLSRLVKRAADRSFNCITVDGDTSTNDSFIVMATGKGPAAASAKDLAALEQAVTEVSQKLAQAIIRDGEGATKFRDGEGRARARARPSAARWRTPSRTRRW